MCDAILHLSGTARLTATPAPPWQHAPPLAHVQAAVVCAAGHESWQKAAFDSRLRSGFNLCFVYRYIPGTRVLLVPTVHTITKHRFVCEGKDRLFMIMNTPRIVIIPNIVVELCSIFYTYGMRDSFWVMSVPLCSSGETRFQPLQGSITDALHRCDSTTWGGNHSAYGHAHVWQRSLGTSKISFFEWLQGPCLFFIFLREDCISLFSFEFPSQTRTCSNQERLTGRRFWLWCSSRLLGGFTRGLLCCLRQTPGVGDCRFSFWVMQMISFPEPNTKTCFPAHFHAFIRQNQLEKENSQQLPRNVLVARACRMSRSNS